MTIAPRSERKLDSGFSQPLRRGGGLDGIGIVPARAVSKSCHSPVSSRSRCRRRWLPLLFVGMPFFAIRAHAVPANIRNATTPSPALAGVVANSDQSMGKEVLLTNINAQCLGGVCSVSAGGQSLLLDNSTLSDVDRQRLMKCAPMGCAAEVRGTVAAMGSTGDLRVPLLRVRSLSLSREQARSALNVSSNQSLQLVPSSPVSSRVKMDSSRNEKGAVVLEETFSFPGFDLIFSYDPVIRDQPQLFAQARNDVHAELQRRINGDGKPARASAVRETIGVHWSTSGSVGRLLTVAATETTNNRPQAQFRAAMLWDAESDRRTSWSEVIDATYWNGKVRSDYCAALQAERRRRGVQGNSSCPSFEDLLIGFQQGANGPSAITFTALAYVAGSYAEGPYAITLPLDSGLRSSIKLPYRDLLSAGALANQPSPLRERLSPVEGQTVGEAAASLDYYFVPSPGGLPRGVAGLFAWIRNNPSLLFATLSEREGAEPPALLLKVDGVQRLLKASGASANGTVRYRDKEIIVQISPLGPPISDNPAYGFREVSFSLTVGNRTETFRAVSFSAV